MVCMNASLRWQVVHAYHMKVVKFQWLSAGVRLRDLYFVYAVVALVFGFHGFYMDGNWVRLQLDGNRLVMHVRLYSLLGLGAWIVGASTQAKVSKACIKNAHTDWNRSCGFVALWLGAVTLSAFGLVEVAYITQSSPNLIYLSTLVAVCVRKPSQSKHCLTLELLH